MEVLEERGGGLAAAQEEPSRGVEAKSAMSWALHELGGGADRTRIRVHATDRSLKAGGSMQRLPRNT